MAIGCRWRQQPLAAGTAPNRHFGDKLIMTPHLIGSRHEIGNCIAKRQPTELEDGRASAQAEEIDFSIAASPPKRAIDSRSAG